ncbi:hypothetical protein ABT272_39540 [Streptomyces sp900105245]|uniref:Uncharacterized protein n=1 Tax=Streptomyces sp. 900105245 TaxID=3154379 RepID=A0ABV1UJA4_9ACTN
MDAAQVVVFGEAAGDAALQEVGAAVAAQGDGAGLAGGGDRDDGGRGGHVASLVGVLAAGVGGQALVEVAQAGGGVAVAGGGLSQAYGRAAGERPESLWGACGAGFRPGWLRSLQVVLAQLLCSYADQASVWLMTSPRPVGSRHDPAVDTELRLNTTEVVPESFKSQRLSTDLGSG